MKSDQKKIVRYVQGGYLLKLKSLLEKINTGRRSGKYDLDFRVGDIRRTPLHIACLLGDDSIVRCLVTHGASTDITDNNKDTPVHIACQFISDVGCFPDYKLLVEPLLIKKPSVISYENKRGETPSQIIEQAKQKYRALKDIDKEDNDKKEDKVPPENWNQKLASELEAEHLEQSNEFPFSSTSSKYLDDEYQTYDQWAEKIFAQYERKHINSHNRKRRKELHNKKRKEEMNNVTSQLLKDHEEYILQAKRMRTEVLNQKRDRYEKKMKSQSKTDTDKLRFRDIPWPCQGNAEEMVEVLLSGIGSNSGKSDKKRFVIRQLVLWHPDKFEQRCGDRLLDRDRSRILDTVKAISQELNKQLELIKSN